MNIETLRKAVPNEELDYVMLSTLFSAYSNPRDKISRLMKSGALIRIKKGIYVFGQSAALGPYSVETLANMIYGPSVISLEYALAWYGMIPERVTTVTNVTTSRNKIFTTTAGRFSYVHQHPNLFAEGCDLIAVNPTHNVLIATREKALVDLLTLSCAVPKMATVSELYQFLSESMRIDDHDLRALNLLRIKRLEKLHKKAIVSLLRQTIEQYKDASYA